MEKTADEALGSFTVSAFIPAPFRLLYPLNTTLVASLEQTRSHLTAYAAI